MVPKKTQFRITPPAPKVSDNKFYELPPESDFNQRSEIAPGVFASFGEGSEPKTKITIEGHHLTCGLKCPFECPPDVVLGEIVKPGDCVCSQSCGKMKTEVESRNRSIEEITTFFEKPTKDGKTVTEFELLVDSDLTPELVVPDSIIVEDEEYPLGFEMVHFNSGSEIILRMEPLYISDSAGNRTKGLYQRILPNGNITYLISKEFLDNAVYPVFVDPTTFVIKGSTVLNGTTPKDNRTKDFQYHVELGNGIYYFGLPYGNSGGSGETYYGELGSLVAETGDNPMAQADYALMHCGKFSDGTVLQAYSSWPSSTSTYTVFRDPGGTPNYSTPVQVADGATNFAAAWMLDFVIDENDRVWMWERSISGYRLWYSDDKGANWTRFATAFPGTIWSGEVARRPASGYAVRPALLAASGNTEIVFIYRDNGTSKLQELIFTASGSIGWGTPTEIVSAITIPWYDGRFCRVCIDLNGAVHVAVKDSSGNLQYVTNSSGSYTASDKNPPHVPGGYSSQMNSDNEYMYGPKSQAAEGRSVFPSDDNDILPDLGIPVSTYQSVVNPQGGFAGWLGDGTGAEAGNIVFVRESEYEKASSADTDAPVISNRVPGDGDSNIDVDTTIAFRVYDENPGVDLTSINVSIGTVSAVYGGVAQSGYGYSTNSIALNTHAMVITPPQLDFSSSIQINIAASDSESTPNIVNDEYSFTTNRDPDAIEYPEFYYNNVLNDAVTITATDTASGFSVNAFHDYELRPLWKGANTNDKTLYFHLASGSSVDSLVIARHNLSGATITFQVSNDNFSADIEEIASWEQLGNYHILRRFTASTKLYQRILITGLTEIPHIGQIFLGSRLIITRPPNNWDHTAELSDIKVVEAESGVKSVHEKSHLRVVDFTLRNIPPELRTNLNMMWGVCGKIRNRFFCARPETEPEGYFGIVFVSRENDNKIPFSPVNADGRFVFKEVP